MKWAVLEKLSPRVWPATVLISIFILCITAYNLYLTRSADRPLLVTTGATLFLNPDAKPPEMVRFTWGNMGRRTALRGSATLFTISEDRRQHEKLGRGEITTGGPTGSSTLTPTFGYGSAEMTVDMHKFLKFFLVCIEYHDDRNTLYDDQKFTFELPDKLGGMNKLEETLSSKNAICTAQP